MLVLQRGQGRRTKSLESAHNYSETSYFRTSCLHLLAQESGLTTSIAQEVMNEFGVIKGLKCAH